MAQCQPFSNEQTRHIVASAELPAQVPPYQPSEFDEVISFFFNFRHNNKPTKESLRWWRALRSNAIALNRNIAASGGVVGLYGRPLIEELGKFIRRCDFEIERASKIDKRKEGSRERTAPYAVYMMAVYLSGEFVRLFDTRPTTSRQGAFHRFVEAFTEAAKNNLPREEAKHIPSGRTLLDHYTSARHIPPNAVLEGDKSQCRT